MHLKLTPDPFLILVNPKTGIACREFRYLERELSKSFKKLTLFFFQTACRPYVTRMSFVCHSYVLVCHSCVLVCPPYITRIYSCIILMSLVCTRISSVCRSYVLVCHPYVTHMYQYVIRMSLVCGFTMNRRPEVFCKKDVLENFAKFTGKPLCQSLFFNEVTKFSTIPFFIQNLRWLLLSV